MRAILMFMAAGIAMAAGWDDVQRISPNHKIEVVTNDHKSISGMFVSATDAALVVRSKTGEESFAREDVTRVRVADPSRRTRSGLIGIAIGASAGLVIGFAVCPQCQNEGAGGKYMAPLTAVGAAVGAAAGFLPTPYRTTYRNK